MRTIGLALAATTLSMMLAGCGGGGTSLSFKQGEDGEGNAVIAMTENGQFSIDTPAFKTSVKLPKFTMDASNVDVNGVKLFPGSTIRDLNVAATDKAGQKDEGKVDIVFDSPAAPAKVRAWFSEKMRARHFTVAENGSGLKGKTDEGEAFTLVLDPQGQDATRGTLRVSGGTE